MENQEEKVYQLKEEDLDKVNGGLLCSVTGWCPMFECKYCGSKLVLKSYKVAGMYQNWGHPNYCDQCYGNVKCTNCKHFKGGIKCAK